MGSRADEAEQRIEEQRKLIERKVEALEERLRDDVGTARERVKERTDEALHALPGVDTLEHQVRDRPLATLGGGLALGMVLGMAGQRGGDSRGDGRSRGPRDRRGYDRYDEDSSDGGGLLGSLLAPAMMAITGPVQSELAKLAREALSGLRSTSDKGRSGSNGH